ncbi:hypothetical protein F5Y18DRAFT_234737 [Xylariaceae sp. FL1019]|nr:hypothetical protein F5Y18DRAFT_234737 [Xylariaceae sp. FL1019]
METATPASDLEDLPQVQVQPQPSAAAGAGDDDTAQTVVPSFDSNLPSLQQFDTSALPNDSGALNSLPPFSNGGQSLLMPSITTPSMPVVTGSNVPQGTNGQAMSADDIALYDRQIRLWGMQAQQKIQAANVLLITMRALGNEIAKNLVLAGVGSLTILDDQIVTAADLGAQFFLTEDNVGQNRAEAAAGQVQRLNPRVKIFPVSAAVPMVPDYYESFDVVIATDLDANALNLINTATRLRNRQFYAAGVHGLYGYIFCDLIEHEYVLKRDKGNKLTTIGPESRFRSVVEASTQKEGSKAIESVKKRDLYSTWDLARDSKLPEEYNKSKRRLKAVTPALTCLRALWSFQAAHGRGPGNNRQDLETFTKLATENHQALSLPTETLRSEFLRSFLQNIGSEIAPVTAILGGQLAQDVINVLGQSQQPIQNTVIFDGEKMEANQYPLHPPDGLGRQLFQSIAAVDPTDFGHMDPSQFSIADAAASTMMPPPSL